MTTAYNEDKYLLAIKMTIEHPYHYTLRQLASACYLCEANCRWLCGLLFLEVKGRQMKNLRNEIKIYIEQHPIKTSIEVQEHFGVSNYLVYQVAREFNLSFEIDNRFKDKMKSNVTNTEKSVN